MREMSRRAIDSQPHTMPPAPSFIKVNSKQGEAANEPERALHENANYANYANNAGYAQPVERGAENRHEASVQGGQKGGKTSAQSGSLFGFDLPILDRIKNEPDMTLVLGILLLLWSEKADKKLLLALLYVLF